MDYPDLMNGAFEMLGAVAILGHVRRVFKDKAVAGVSIWSTVFFASWGFWNLYYYPQLEQWASLAGGVAIVLGNCLWIGGLVYYTRHPKGKIVELGDCEAPPKRCDTCKNRLIDAVHLVETAMKLRRLITAQGHYVALLEGEIAEVVPLANAHGWASTRFATGERLREGIAELKLDAGVPE